MCEPKEQWSLKKLKEIFPGCTAETIYQASKHCEESHIYFVLGLIAGKDAKIKELEAKLMEASNGRT